MMRRIGLTFLACLALACAPARAAPAPAHPVWAFQTSDVPLDPAFRFGRLANGMRYVIRHNETPKGVVLVRLRVDAGSLDERDAERGFAHFVEHMAFQGSTHVAPGEMVRLLERLGLAFGADTNAATYFDNTTYMLDLPRNEPALLDTALMLMRETASELSFPAAAVARERGVVLSEKRDRNSWQYRNLVDQIGFAAPAARYGQRMPIGTTEALNAATAQSLRTFWSREYVPAKTTLVVIGDIDPAATEAAIRAHFADWRAAPSPRQPAAGPIAANDAGRTRIYLDPALAERVTASRAGAWLHEPDTLAMRREELLRRIGYGIVNRRLDHLAHRADPPFRDAGFGTQDIFRAARSTLLVVDAVEGRWREGLAAAALEYRRALAQGFTAAEVAEQLANIRTEAEHAAAAAHSRADKDLVNAVFALIHDEQVPSEPEGDLARLAALAPQVTPAAVLAALNREALALDAPLIRFEGRAAPEGGEPAIRAAWDEAMREPLPPAAAAASGGFAYTDFGPAGTVVSDTREGELGIRQIRFANGLRLNLKHTDLEKDRILVSLTLDGGQMLATKANPTAVAMAWALPEGGLGKHSADDLQTMLAGHEVGASFTAEPDAFTSAAQTTPADLALQLELMAALVTDPGYRPEGETQYRLSIDNFFAQRNATPASALHNALGGILSDGDPRYSLADAATYRALSFARLRADLADRLAHGAIEIGLVGDLDEAQAIALVGKTFGALPPREADFGAWSDQRQRPFTADHSPRLLRHTGPADQALLYETWLTRDDADPVAKQVLNLLQSVVQIELTETLRQKLGKAYSPGAASELSRAWRGYGTFSVSASVDVRDLAAARAALAETIAALRDHPVSADILLRARAPLAQMFDNALKTNGGWMAIVARAQSQSDRVDRQVKAHDRLMALTASDVQAAARRYLTDAGAVAITVLPAAAQKAAEEPQTGAQEPGKAPPSPPTH